MRKLYDSNYLRRSDPPSRDDLLSFHRRLGGNQLRHESRSTLDEDFLSPRKTLFEGPDKKLYRGRLSDQYGANKERMVCARGGGERSKSLKIPFHRIGNVQSTITPKSNRRYSQEIPNTLSIPNTPSTGYFKENACMVTSWHVSNDSKIQQRFDK